MNASNMPVAKASVQVHHGFLRLNILFPSYISHHMPEYEFGYKKGRPKQVASADLLSMTVSRVLYQTVIYLCRASLHG